MGFIISLLSRSKQKEEAERKERCQADKSDDSVHHSGSAHYLVPRRTINNCAIPESLIAISSIRYLNLQTFTIWHTCNKDNFTRAAELIKNSCSLHTCYCCFLPDSFGRVTVSNWWWRALSLQISIRCLRGIIDHFTWFEILKRPSQDQAFHNGQ